MNIAMLLDLVADTLGERVALTDDGGDLTYDELRALARGAARQLARDSVGTLAFADASSRSVHARHGAGGKG